jgi:hypothetical protein
MLLYCHPNRMMSKDTPKMQFFWGIEELSKDWYLALYGNPGVLHQGSTGWQPVQMDPQGVAQWLRNPNQVPMDLLKRMAEPPQMVLSKANRSGDVSKKVKLDSGYVFVEILARYRICWIKYPVTFFRIPTHTMSEFQPEIRTSC